MAQTDPSRERGTDDAQDDHATAHYHPISVRDAPGDTFAVAVRETYSDGSGRVQHYTQEQAQDLLSGLQNALDDTNDTEADA
jgi:hypothetical protein